MSKSITQPLDLSLEISPLEYISAERRTDFDQARGMRRKITTLRDRELEGSRIDKFSCGPDAFDAGTTTWSAEKADLILISAGEIGPDSMDDFKRVFLMSRRVLIVRTYTSRVDIWLRALWPVTSPVFTTIFTAILPTSSSLPLFSDAAFEASYRLSMSDLDSSADHE